MSKSTKNATKPVCGKECFNCFKQGHCDYNVEFHNADGSPSRDKPLHFCSLPCRDAYVHSDTIPTYLYENQKCIEFLEETLSAMKMKPRLLIVKKVSFIEKMFRTSLAERKPKAELRRLFALWQECATDTLTTIGEKHQESMLLQYADLIKQNDKTFPCFIQILGR